jgi:dihydrofolate reductase
VPRFPAPVRARPFPTSGEVPLKLAGDAEVHRQGESNLAYMGTIIATEYVSIDGVIQAPGGGEEYRHAGWTFKVNRGAEGDKFKLDEAMDSEALLLGRTTYEAFAEVWPKMAGNPFSDKFNSMPKYVVSSKLKDPAWNNTTVLDGDLATEIAKLKQEVSGNIVVHGSPQLVQGLVEHKLLDELRLMVFPVILGVGKKLFAETSDLTWMELKGRPEVVGDGIVVLTYVRKP